VEKLKGIAERRQTTPGAVAVAWTLHHPAVGSPVLKARVSLESLGCDRRDLAALLEVREQMAPETTVAA
jgi:hypothetical protein